MALRAVPAAALALGLASCATRDPFVTSTGPVKRSGDWRIEQQIDRITGKPVSSAFVVTLNASNTYVEFPRPAQLQLSCFRTDPLVRFAFDFKVGSTRNSVLGYRFDEKPGHEPEARFVSDYRHVVIEDRDAVEKFLAELVTSKLLFVRIRSINGGRTAAEFNIEGAGEAVDKALAGCRSSPPPAGRAKA